jgi:hypothetical protein
MDFQWEMGSSPHFMGRTLQLYKHEDRGIETVEARI